MIGLARIDLKQQDAVEQLQVKRVVEVRTGIVTVTRDDLCWPVPTLVLIPAFDRHLHSRGVRRVSRDKVAVSVELEGIVVRVLRAHRRGQK